MNLIILMGLLFIGLGIFIWATADVLSRVASSSYTYLRPSQNKEDFRRRSTFRTRTLGIFFLLIGIGIVVYGLLGGR